MIYDYYKEKGKKGFKGKFVALIVAFLVAVAIVISSNIYLEIVQLNEIGNYSSVFVTNLMYKLASVAFGFILIFLATLITNIFIKKNIKNYLEKNELPQRKLPNLSAATIIAVIGAFLSKDFFFEKALTFLNSTAFGKVDPIFSKDLGYYVFQRPFLMSFYEFASALWIFIIVYTILYYIVVFTAIFSNNFSLDSLKVKSIIMHNLINIAVFFVIKTFSYNFLKEGILYSNVVNVTGASYVDVNIWLNYYTIAPILILLIVAISLVFLWKGKLKKAAITIAVFPAIWIVVSITAGLMHALVVKPNEINLESPYLKYNMQKTREAYRIDTIKNIEFPAMQDLTPEVINRNIETKNNIRVVDYKATLDSNVQLQSNTNFYTFYDGDIVNYTVNGKEVPVLLTAREVDKNKLPEKSYVNTMYKYTHGYGVVINPINRLTSGGQVEFILSGLRMDSTDKNLKVTEPRIYYGELTGDPVIVNAGNNLNEIDYDGNSETRYTGTGGIKLSLTNRLLFALKYGDFNMVISGFVTSESKLLVNRQIVERAKKAAPFLEMDNDPYIILTDDGRLKWVLDAYTTSGYYPYSQHYENFNYIRNSVKIIIDAYDGSLKFYIIDKNDPIINTYKKIYPKVFTEEPLPTYITHHMRYPEFLFRVQTDMLKLYHLDPNIGANNISTFYSRQDLWDIAKYPQHNNTSEASDVADIEPYYNMIKLPGDLGQKEELILMRPFTPSKKNNMVSWLALRNSGENYGDMILFSFPKNTNILGPYQIEVKINQIDKVSKDMTLWGQSGSRVFKGSLLVIPIESSVLYVEPIYIQAAGTSSIPEVREIIVGYQKGEEFKYGVGTSLDDALGQLFAGIAPTPGTTPTTTVPNTQPSNNVPQDKQKLISDIMAKYDAMKKQLDELGNLINELSK